MAGDPHTVFYDDKNRLAALQAVIGAADFRYVKDLPSPQALSACRGGAVTLALANDKLQKAAADMRGTAYSGVSVIPGHIGVQTAPIPIDISKPRLDYMETEITHVCNLNCRGCCGFMNIVSGEERYYALGRFTADLKRLKELFWGIGKIRLMGGEPLLNPDLADHVEAAREIFPDCDLRIVTNGLLLPTLSKETLERVKKAGCSFDISNYPPTQKKKKEILAALGAAGVGCNFSIPMRYFFRNLRQTPDPSPAPAFNNCIFTHCHMLLEGRLSPCSFAACTYRYNRRYGAMYPETDGFDLSDPGLDGWRIVDAFASPHEFCRYCGSGIIPIRWQGHCAAAQAKESDWQIPDTFVCTKIAPKVQSAVKKSAKTLRARLQKKEGN